MLDIVLLVISIVFITAGYLWLRKTKTPTGEPDMTNAAVTATVIAQDDITDSDIISSDKSELADKSEPADKSGPQKAPDEAKAKRNKRSRIIAIAVTALGCFLFISRLINIIFGPSRGDVGHFELWPARVDVLGMNVSITIVYSWLVMVLLIVAAIFIRIAAFSKPKDIPSGLQNVIETIVETVSNYTSAQAHGTGEMLCSYILSIGSFLVMCAFMELFRLRAPTSDITITFSLAFMTFIIINIYGIKKKGVFGRVKSLAEPTPIVLPFRLISEIAIPVSLACRLFGNMLGGMIVVDLLYNALGNNAVGIPGILGLYFNAFHPLIQAFIFITLTLTFINEAIE